MKLGRRVRMGFRCALAALLVPVCWLGVRWWTGNIGEIIPGTFYRSSQLDAGHLTHLIRQHRIRSVINLRGPNPDTAWYRAERSATLASGATQVDVPLASDLWLSRAQARALVELLDEVETPALVHCQWGAERTGLVAAILQLLRPGGRLEDAEAEFSLHYLFARYKDGKVMAGHLDAYKSWLAAGGHTHSPARFRHWLLDVYRPLGPSRDDWSFNPYPLVVVTRPGAREPGRVAATDRADPPR